MLRRAYLRLRSLLLRARLESEMREEMSAHITEAAARNVAGGMSPAAALKAARREFGNFDFIEEEARDARGWRWIDALRGDVRFALRHFRRTPLATATMVLVLALGVGVNVVLYVVFHSMSTHPGPGIEPDAALVRIRGTALVPSASSLEGRRMSYPEVLAYNEQRDLFAGIGATIDAVGRISTVGAERPASTAAVIYVSDHYFNLLRVRPQLGRVPAATPLDASDAAALGVVITHATWVEVFDSIPDVIGRTLRVNNVAATVVGVMPPFFRGTTDAGPHFRVWFPLAAYPVVAQSGMYAFASPDSALFRVIARLQPGVSRREALPVVKGIASRASAAMTNRPERSIASADVVALVPYNINPASDREVQLVVAGISILTVLLLLVTCTNVSSLLVGMAVARRREIAVRLSLGAGRRRLIMQMLTESALIALSATALALFIMWSFITYIDARFPTDNLGEFIVFDWRAALFSGGIALLAALLFGLSPALHGTRLALADVLKDAGAAVSGTRSRLHRGLVVTQIALTQPLLVALGVTALIGQRELQRMMPGPHEDRIVEMYFDVHDPAFNTATAVAELDRVRERLASVAGVVAVAPESYMTGRGLVVHHADRTITSQLPDTLFVFANSAMPGFLTVHGVSIIRGRDFTAADVDSVQASIIIDDKLAHALFGSADPIGRRLLMPADPMPKTIVGIVSEEQTRPLRNGQLGTPLVFLSPRPATEFAHWMLVRTAGDGSAMIPALRAAAAGEVPQLVLRSANTSAVARANNRRELMGIGAAIGAGAIVTLLLSAIGLYAVVAFAVAQRTREIGIRTALGARSLQVTTLFFRSGLRLSLLGLFIGLSLSLIPLQLIPGVTGGLTGTLSVAALVGGGVLLVASLATWIPARRAARLDPLIALRSE